MGASFGQFRSILRELIDGQVGELAGKKLT